MPSRRCISWLRAYVRCLRLAAAAAAAASPAMARRSHVTAALATTYPSQPAPSAVLPFSAIAHRSVGRDKQMTCHCSIAYRFIENEAIGIVDA